MRGDGPSMCVIGHNVSPGDRPHGPCDMSSAQGLCMCFCVLIRVASRVYACVLITEPGMLFLVATLQSAF